MAKKILVLVFEAGEIGQRPTVREIDNTLEAMQAIVGGYIEPHNGHNGLMVLCDDMGASKGLPPNAASVAVCGKMLVGTFFVCRQKGSDFASVRDSDVKAYGAIPLKVAKQV